MPGCVHPGEPSFLETVTFIKMYALNTCSTPWEVWLKTGGKAVQNLSMTMLFIDTGDLARSFFRPKKARAGRHAMPWLGRGKKRFKPGWIPEPSDLIADTTRSATGLKRPRYSDGYNHLWTLDTQYQKFMNKVVFVNMATDFGYDWFSGILTDPRSKCSIGRALCGYPLSPRDDGEWTMMHGIGACAVQNQAIGGPNSIFLGEGKWAVNIAVIRQHWANETGFQYEALFMVGDEERMRPCGKIMEIQDLGFGKTDAKEEINVVSGPVAIRVIGRWVNWDTEDVNNGFQCLIRAFRID